jgi:hypothetical protein
MLWACLVDAKVCKNPNLTVFVSNVRQGAVPTWVKCLRLRIFPYRSSADSQEALIARFWIRLTVRNVHAAGCELETKSSTHRCSLRRFVCLSGLRSLSRFVNPQKIRSSAQITSKSRKREHKSKVAMRSHRVFGFSDFKFGDGQG